MVEYGWAGHSAGAPTVPFRALGIAPGRSVTLPVEAPGATDLDCALESHPASAPPNNAVPASAVALSILRRVIFDVCFI